MPLSRRKLPPVSTTMASVAAARVSPDGGVANHSSPPRHDKQQAPATSTIVRKAPRISVIGGLRDA
jgi:hypothetical protein